MTETEPTCTQPEHGWFELGVEDNGDTAARCGSCMAMRYTTPQGEVRYEAPAE